jgi:hypothetical protein
MALSNWDTYALTLEGEPCDGEFTSSRGISVAFYKNWLYLRDPQAWHDGLGFIEPTIMSINHGDLRFGNIQLMAIRGPKNGVYGVVWTGHESLKDLQGMAGIGCYGFDENGEWVGVEEAEITFLRDQLRQWTEEYEIPQPFGELDFAQGLRFNQGDAYFAGMGVAPNASTKVGESEEPLLIQALKPDRE